MLRIEHLYLSPGHNYFGHHGKPADEHPILSVPSLECVSGHGIRGDRFFDYKPDYKGQITFFAAEIYDELCETLLPRLSRQSAKRDGGAFRRNVITRGVDLNSLIGEEFTLQGVTFLGTGECSPCHWMDQAFASGTEDALKGRGGLRAKILTNGLLRLDARQAV
ncbi:MAG: molybdenum cofactor biosysynthesis protein [Opitutaceae bacterium]|nr:molybdenum cofactor biosysynthesis protein [Opitutaceae bacterium]